MGTLVLMALLVLASQDAADAERELEQLIEPELSLEELGGLTRSQVLDVVDRSDFLPRMQSFERRWGLPPRSLQSWPAAADRLGALVDALRCRPDWLPEQDPLGYRTLVVRACLLGALGRDDDVDADLDRAATLKPSRDVQLAMAKLGLLRAARADRQADVRAAWDQRVIAAASACSSRRHDLRDAALIQLALMLRRERRDEDSRALLASAAGRYGGLAGPSVWPRHRESVSDARYAPTWLREWAEHELARLETVAGPAPDHLEWLDAYSVVAFRMQPRDECEAPRLLAIVLRHDDGQSTALRPGRDDLATVPGWLAKEFRRTPGNWDDAIAILTQLPDPGPGLADLIAGVHLLAPSSTEGLADADAALRLGLGDGPETIASPALTARQFLAAWEPWLATRGLIKR